MRQKRPHIASLDEVGITREAALERQTEAPIRLPSPDEIKKLVFDLEHRLQQAPLGGREQLRRMFKDERIVLYPQHDRVCLARSELLPLMLLAEKNTTSSVAVLLSHSQEEYSPRPARPRVAWRVSLLASTPASSPRPSSSPPSSPSTGATPRYQPA